MKRTVIIVVILAAIVMAGIILSRHRSASNPEVSTPGPAIQKAEQVKMDSFSVDGLTLDLVLDMLNDTVARRHGGVEAHLATTARDKEKTLIKLNLQNTSFAEILDNIAEAADLTVTEQDNKIVLVPKKKSP